MASIFRASLESPISMNPTLRRRLSLWGAFASLLAVAWLIHRGFQPVVLGPAETGQAAVVRVLNGPVRGADIQIIGSMPDVTVPLLTEALRDTDTLVDKLWMKSWSKLPTALKSRIRPPLPASLKRRKALIVLRELGPASAPALPVLIEAVAAEVAADRREVLLVIERIGAAAAPWSSELTGLLAVGDPRVDWSVKQTLLAVGPEAVEALTRGLSHNDPLVQIQCAELLGRMRVNPGRSVQLLTGHLAAGDGQIRSRAATSLGWLGQDAVPALSAMIGSLHTGDTGHQAAVVASFRMLGTNGVPALTSALGDANSVIRAGAATALHQLGPAASPAVPALLQSVAHDDATTAAAAAQALWLIDPAARSNYTVALRLLKHDDAHLVAQAAHALGTLGSAAKAAVPALVTLREHEHAFVRREAGRALNRIAPGAGN
jgi:hypothetical protein